MVRKLSPFAKKVLKWQSHSSYAWLVWLAASMLMLYKNVIEVSPSIMTNTLMSSFHISAAGLGNLAACYFYAYLLMQLPAGLLIDKYGPRKITTLAFLTCSAGFLLFSYSEQVWVACIGRFLTGTGAAFAAINCFKLLSNWFSMKRFAFLAGLMMTFAMLGAVLGQAPLAAFIHKVQWREAVQILSYVGFALSIIFWLVVRDRSPLKSEGHRMTSEKITVWKSLSYVVGNRQSWWLSLYSGLVFTPVSVFGGLWGVPFVEEAYSLSHNLSAQAVSLIFIGFAVGAPVLGWLSDRFGNRKAIMFWGTFFALIFISCILYFPNAMGSVLHVSLFLCGFSLSSFLLSFTMIRQVNAPIVAATAVGFMNGFNALFGAFSDPLTGMFLDARWSGKVVDGIHHFDVSSYQIALSALVVYLVIALVTLLKIKDTHDKPTFPATMN